MRFVLFKKIEILQQFLIKFLQTKDNNFKSFRFFAKSMLTIIRKVILDILMQKEIEFIIRARKIKSLFANRKWNFCACALIFILRGCSRTQLLFEK